MTEINETDQIDQTNQTNSPRRASPARPASLALCSIDQPDRYPPSALRTPHFSIHHVTFNISLHLPRMLSFQTQPR